MWVREVFPDSPRVHSSRVTMLLSSMLPSMERRVKSGGFWKSVATQHTAMYQQQSLNPPRETYSNMGKGLFLSEHGCVNAGLVTGVISCYLAVGRPSGTPFDLYGFPLFLCALLKVFDV